MGSAHGGVKQGEGHMFREGVAMFTARRALSLSLLLCLGACCAVGEKGDPPSLTLTQPVSDVPDVPIHPTNVKVTNGSGEVVLDGVPDSDYRVTGRPSRSKLDGTLNVTTTYDNGTSKTQTLTHDPGKPVKLAWDKSLDQYVVDTTPTPGVTTASSKDPGAPGWAVQIFADYKLTPYDSTTLQSSGSAVKGSPDLSESMSSLGFGFRRYFQATSSGIQPFAYVGFSEYFGNGTRQADVVYHFGATPDSGGEIKEQRSFMLGAGGQVALSSNLMFGLMAGLHATRMRISVFSDERSGSGPDNQFSTNRWLYGPTLGASLTMPLFSLGPGSPVIGFLMYQAMLMKDVSHSGVSPFTSNTYTIRADGGIQHKIMLGLEKRF